MHPTARVSLGPIQNPVRGLVDATAAALAVLAALHLFSLAGEAPRIRIAIALFCATQIGLCTVSCLYHAVPWTPPWKRRMQRLDHSMIYLKIAGVLTPLAVLAADDWRGEAVLVAAWAIAAAGVVQKLFFPHVHERASIPVQIAQACLVLPVLPGFADRLPGHAMPLVAMTGAFHLAGAAIFVTERPRLWPHLFSFHDLFHLLLVGGGILNYTVLLHLLRALPA